MKKDFTYNQSIEFAAELFTKALHEALRKIHKEMNFEINHEEYIILETIFLNPGIIQIDIAKKIITKRSYVCKFLSRLESRGYIRRENAIRGTRQIIMKNYITKEGERVYTKVRNYFIKTFEERKNELLKKGKEKGVLTYEELAESLKGLDLDADSLDELYNAFHDNNIEIISENFEDEDNDEDEGDALVIDDSSLPKLSLIHI